MSSLFQSTGIQADVVPLLDQLDIDPNNNIHLFDGNYIIASMMYINIRCHCKVNWNGSRLDSYLLGDHPACVIYKNPMRLGRKTLEDWIRIPRYHNLYQVVGAVNGICFLGLMAPGTWFYPRVYAVPHVENPYARELLLAWQNERWNNNFVGTHLFRAA